MSGKRNPWINVILVLAVLAFVGFSMIPLLGTAFKQQQPSTVATPTPTSTISGEKRTEIEAQVKGYELVLKREPQNPTALRGLVEGKLQLGDIKGAIPPLEEFAKLNPSQTDYTVLLAQLKQRTGDPEGAALAYREILATKPGDLNALEGYAELQIAQKRPEAAIALIQDTLKTANQLNDVQAGTVDVPSVQLLLGQVYASQQRYTEALVIYDEAIRVNKQDFRPVLAKAMILKQQGKTAEAQSLFTTAVSLAPAQYKDQVKRLATESTQPSGTPTPPAPNLTP